MIIPLIGQQQVLILILSPELTATGETEYLWFLQICQHLQLMGCSNTILLHMINIYRFFLVIFKLMFIQLVCVESTRDMDLLLQIAQECSFIILQRLVQTSDISATLQVYITIAWGITQIQLTLLLLCFIKHKMVPPYQLIQQQSQIHFQLAL